MAIGSAVFWPLNQKIDSNMREIEHNNVAIQRQMEDLNKAQDYRLDAIESRLNKEADADRWELRAWRNKVYKLSAPKDGK